MAEAAQKSREGRHESFLAGSIRADQDFPARAGLFGGAAAEIRAADDVSFFIRRGETLALVGESGSGKTTVARTLLGLEKSDAGIPRFDGVDLLKCRRNELNALRRRIQIVFQDPFATLNPRRRVGDSVGEGLVIHHLAAGNDLRRQPPEAFERVGLPPESAGRLPGNSAAGSGSGCPLPGPWSCRRTSSSATNRFRRWTCRYRRRS